MSKQRDNTEGIIMLYKYKCNNCNEVEEIIHDMNDKITVTCDKCEEEMTKVLSGAFKLIGTGWAEDSYSKVKV